MKNKVKISLIAALVLLAALMVITLASCDKSQGNVKTLYVYNWGEYISDGSDDSLDVNKAFEEFYFKKYGEKIKVNYSTYSSNEDMYAKLSSGATSYDVIVPSDYMIERMIKEDMLCELNFENIPNVQYIKPEFKGENAYYDTAGKYSVPYTCGMVGIIYNSKEIPENEPTLGSWALMWNEKYKGNILQFNNSRDAFGTAQYFLGLDVNDENPESWNKAFDKLLAQKSIVQGYVMDEIFNKMENGSAIVAPYYAGDFFTMYANNEDLAFYYPKEGTNIFVDAMCVPKCAKNKELAEIYINFMLSEEIAIANAEYICYASPNSLVTESEEYRAAMEELHPDAMDILYNSAEAVNTQYFKNLSDSQLNTLNTLWDNLKISSEVDSTIYWVAGIVIAVIAVGAVAAVIIRKKRRDLRNSV